MKIVIPPKIWPSTRKNGKIILFIANQLIWGDHY